MPDAGLLQVRQVEVDFGSTPTDSLITTINDAQVNAGSKIFGNIAYDAPTGKELDEIEMDEISVSCGNAGSGTFSLQINAVDGSFLAGKFKINYVVGY